MSILVLGADGYIGWALMCRLAARVREPLIAVDDLSKRGRVRSIGSDSALPILDFDERLERLRAVTQRHDIAGVNASVEDCIETLVREHRPRTVVHLAQIPSAPWSMQSFASARETLVGNEVGNLALLFALREHAPDAHLVKMGSMGEYDHCGVPLGEGYVEAILDGVPASRPVPFPRAADDVYHITKINDSNFIAMATRVWGLAATDVMQSIVYGTRTTLWRQDPALCTRFDCDPIFGSVVNRFVAQAVLGTPLTVHGGGHATTGLISLYDAVAALAHWVEHPAKAGEHRVINQATETRISIRGIARLVREAAAEHGIAVGVDTSLDPRHEACSGGNCGPARNIRLREARLPSIPLADGIALLFRDLLEHRERLQAAGWSTRVDWKTGRAVEAEVPLDGTVAPDWWEPDVADEVAPAELLLETAGDTDLGDSATAA